MSQQVIVGDQHYEFPDGMSDKDMAAALKLDMTPSPATPTSTGPEFNPDMYPMDKPPAEQIVRPIAEAGGFLLGGNIGGAAGFASPVPGGAAAGAVAGAGLGYGIAKGSMDLLYGKKEPSLGGSLLQSGKDVSYGMRGEMGGQVVGKVVGEVGQAIVDSKAAQRLYASAMKFPLSKKWRKVRSPEDISMIEQATNKGLDEKVPPSEYGLEKARYNKVEALKEIKAGVDKTAGTGNTEDIVNKGLARAIKEAKSGDNPIVEKQVIEDFAAAYKAGRAGELTAREMQDAKVWLHNRVDYDRVSGKADPLVESMRKGIAHELRLKLEALNPALRNSNQSYADWKVLEEALDTSLARTGNRDLVSLGTKVLLGRESWALAAFNQTIGHPQVKAQIAFMLRNANKATGSSVIRPAAAANLLSP